MHIPVSALTEVIIYFGPVPKRAIARSFSKFVLVFKRNS